MEIVLFANKLRKNKVIIFSKIVIWGTMILARIDTNCPSPNNCGLHILTWTDHIWNNKGGTTILSQPSRKRTLNNLSYMAS